MSENYIVINGKKAELTQEQLKALGIEVKKPSPFERQKNGFFYYFIGANGKACSDLELNRDRDDVLFDVANYCTDRDLFQQQAYRETLNRLLWRFSMEHGGDRIDWSDNRINKYFIYYSHMDSEWKTDSNQYCRGLGLVYFHSVSIAEQAVEEIITPFMESHPDFKL